MEYLPNGYTLEAAEEAFPLSTDSVILAHFAKLPKNAAVLDLGSGCGTLGMLLCAKDAGCTVTGIELSEAAHRCADDNIRRNGLESRLQSICGDLRRVPEMFASGSFSCCISNPPYFSGGPSSRQHTAARREDDCTLKDVITSAAWALKYGGDFFLVHRPERLGDIIARSAEAGLEAKRLLLLRHSPKCEISIIALQLRKGGKPGLKIEEACLYDASGMPTPYYKDVYHIPYEEA